MEEGKTAITYKSEIKMKATILVILMLLNYGCTNNSVPYFEFSELKKIAQLSSVEPPPAIITFTPVYIIGADDSISQTSFEKLHRVYETSFKEKYSMFSEFLFNILNQKIKINTKDTKTSLYFSQTFVSDSSIKVLYIKSKIKGLMNKYCNNDGATYVLKRQSLTLEEINTISYYFFINQFIRVDNDYSGAITFKSLYLSLK